jgi:hypothetical protein
LGKSPLYKIGKFPPDNGRIVGFVKWEQGKRIIEKVLIGKCVFFLPVNSGSLESCF